MRDAAAYSRKLINSRSVIGVVLYASMGVCGQGIQAAIPSLGLRNETSPKANCVMVSVGVACTPATTCGSDHAHTADDLVVRADQALYHAFYQAKHAGRNAVRTA